MDIKYMILLTFLGIKLILDVIHFTTTGGRYVMIANMNHMCIHGGRVDIYGRRGWGVWEGGI